MGIGIKSKTCRPLLLAMALTFLGGILPSEPSTGIMDEAQAENIVKPTNLSEQEIAEMLAAHERWLNNPTDPNGQRADHPAGNFYGKNLRGANLYRAKFKGAIFDQADLRDANLQQAHMATASLKKANLQDVNLQQSFLRQAKLSEGNLMGANLKGAALDRVVAKGTLFIHSDLSNANLHSANLEGSNLQGARLQGANLSHASLRGSNLSNADLRGAKLFGANLTGANLSNTLLQSGMSIEGIDLTKTIGLKQEELDKACLDEKTKLPPHLLRPKPCPLPNMAN